MSRVKQVVATDMVAHLWVHQQQDHARNPQYNFYFDGKSIYSYGRHFEIARIIADKVCMMTTAKHSNTTAGHVSTVYRAIPADWTVINVPDFHNTGEAVNYNLVCIGNNIKHFTDKIEDFANKQKTARKVDYVPKIKETIEKFKFYIDYFKLKKLVPKYFNFLFTLDLSDNQALLDNFGLVHNAKLKERKSNERKLKKEQELRISEWLEGKHHIGSISNLMGDKVYLRLRTPLNDTVFSPEELEEATFLETSKSVSVPVKEAKRLFLGVCKIRKSSYSEDTINNLLVKLGINKIDRWNIDRITKDGDVIAGCHRIPWSEIERFATKYNWEIVTE